METTCEMCGKETTEFVSVADDCDLCKDCEKIVDEAEWEAKMEAGICKCEQED